MEENQEITIGQLVDNLETASVNELILALSTIVCDSRKYPQLQDRLQEIQGAYDNMLDMFLKGYADPHRAEFVKRFKEKLAEIVMDVRLYDAINANSTLQTIYKRSTQIDLMDAQEQLVLFTMEEGKLKENSVGGNDPKLEEFYKKRADYYNKLFSAILVSSHHKQVVSEKFVLYAASSMADEVGVCLAISAFTLSALLSFDYRKAQIMMDIYSMAEKVTIKERALVGWVFAVCCAPQYYHKHLAIFIDKLMEDERVRVELQDLQKQIIYCMDAEKDADIMQKDVFSAFPRGRAQSAIILKDDLDESTLDEIIHPEQDDDMAEKMEQSIQKMRDMEKAGKDIYFDGFSKMKSFAFFHTLSNWFLPFYPENPSCKEVIDVLEGDMRLLENMQRNSPFCESDKYSFCYAMSLSLKSFVPAPLKDFLKEGLLFGDEFAPLHSNIKKAAFVRRMYLQDLFRFFRLAPFRGAFLSPFDEGVINNVHPFFLINEIFCKESMSSEILNVMRFLMKKKDDYRLQKFLCYGRRVLMDDPDFNMISIIYTVNIRHDYEDGIYTLVPIIEQQPDNILAHKLLAKCYYGFEDYAHAAEEYQKIQEANPSDSILLKIACCWLNLCKHKEALNVLYELDYKHPNDVNIMRALAWGLTLRGDYAKAAPIYNKVEATLKDKGQEVLSDDKFNEGINSWLAGNLQEARGLFSDCIGLGFSDTSFDLMKKFEHEDKFLTEHGIKFTDRMLMMDNALQEQVRQSNDKN